MFHFNHEHHKHFKEYIWCWATFINHIQLMRATSLNAELHAMLVHDSTNTRSSWFCFSSNKPWYTSAASDISDCQCEWLLSWVFWPWWRGDWCWMPKPHLRRKKAQPWHPLSSSIWSNCLSGSVISPRQPGAPQWQTVCCFSMNICCGSTSIWWPCVCLAATAEFVLFKI